MVVLVSPEMGSFLFNEFLDHLFVRVFMWMDVTAQRYLGAFADEIEPWCIFMVEHSVFRAMMGRLKHLNSISSLFCCAKNAILLTFITYIREKSTRTIFEIPSDVIANKWVWMGLSLTMSSQPPVL